MAELVKPSNLGLPSFFFPSSACKTSRSVSLSSSWSVRPRAALALTKLYSSALDSWQITFDAGTRYAYMRVYEWIQLQLQNGTSVTATDMCDYLQDKLNQLDSNMLNAQQQVEIEQSADEVLLENDMHNAHQLPEHLTNGSHSGTSGNTNENPSASQVQEMETTTENPFLVPS